MRSNPAHQLDDVMRVLALYLIDGVVVILAALRRSLALRVVGEALPVDHHTRLVGHGPGIMAWRELIAPRGLRPGDHD